MPRIKIQTYGNVFLFEQFYTSNSFYFYVNAELLQKLNVLYEKYGLKPLQQQGDLAVFCSKLKAGQFISVKAQSTDYILMEHRDHIKDLMAYARMHVFNACERLNYPSEFAKDFLTLTISHSFNIVEDIEALNAAHSKDTLTQYLTNHYLIQER